MNYPNNMMHNHMPTAMLPYEDTAPMQVSCVDRFVVDALRTLIGTRVVVETTRGGMHGRLVDVKPDHIVLGELYGDTIFFIRIAEIVHVMPNVNHKG